MHQDLPGPSSTPQNEPIFPKGRVRMEIRKDPCTEKGETHSLGATGMALQGWCCRDAKSRQRKERGGISRKEQGSPCKAAQHSGENKLPEGLSAPCKGLRPASYSSTSLSWSARRTIHGIKANWGLCFIGLGLLGGITPPSHLPAGKGSCFFTKQ